MKELLLSICVASIFLAPVAAIAAEASKHWVDENTINNQSIFMLEKARELIQAMKVKAEEIKVPMVVSVVDAAGDLVALERMDGTLLISLKIAPNKARTAARIRLSTEDLAQAAAAGATLFGIHNDPEVVIFGGGIPLVHNGFVVGAVGVSGGSVEEDVTVAKAGVAAFEKK